MTFLAIIIFILVFSFLIIAHEWGHFIAARKAGAKVEEFGLGLPPRMWGWRKNKTSMLYSINWIPFGGFVRIKGEGGEDTGKDDSLSSKSYGARILVTVGGVLMNFATAFVLLMIGFWMGMPPLATDVSQYVDDASAVSSRILILNVDEGSPAEQAGVRVPHRGWKCICQIAAVPSGYRRRDPRSCGCDGGSRPSLWL